MTEFNLKIEELKPYCNGFNKEQLTQALQICYTYKLTPTKRQIHLQKRWTKNGDVISPIVTIDGLRGIAERSGGYQGQVGAFWCGDDGVWKDVWISNKPPIAAKVGVWKANFKEALFSVAKFEEYKQLDRNNKVTGMWVKMPDLMIAKCAEALALRRAFPDELGGLYTNDEMAQASNPESKDDIAAKALGGSMASNLDPDDLKKSYNQAIKMLGQCDTLERLKTEYEKYYLKRKSFGKYWEDIEAKKEECKDDIIKDSGGYNE